MLGGKMIDNRTAWANSARRLQRPDPCPGRPQSPARCRAGPGSWPGPNSQATCWEAASGQEGLGSRDSAAAPPAPASLEERGDSKPRASAAHPPWSQGTAAGLTRAARLFIRLGITDVRNKLLQLLQKRCRPREQEVNRLWKVGVHFLAKRLTLWKMLKEIV